MKERVLLLFLYIYFCSFCFYSFFCLFVFLTCDGHLPLSPHPGPPPASAPISVQSLELTPSILISVVVFGHSVAWWQWIGIVCVFSGLSLSVRAKYAAKKGRVEIPAEAGVSAGNGGGIDKEKKQ